MVITFPFDAQLARRASSNFREPAHRWVVLDELAGLQRRWASYKYGRPMPRKPSSPADEVLLATARARGATVSATQLERWRSGGLLPRNVTRSLGRGCGSTSTPAEGAVELVVWLAQHSRPGRRPHDLALLAFGKGLAVPEPTVRAAWRASVQRVVLPGEQNLPASADDEARADQIWHMAERAATSAASVVLPRRIRRIDERVAAAGVSWLRPNSPNTTAAQPARNQSQAGSLQRSPLPPCLVALS